MSVISCVSLIKKVHQASLGGFLDTTGLILSILLYIQPWLVQNTESKGRISPTQHSVNSPSTSPSRSSRLKWLFLDATSVFNLPTPNAFLQMSQGKCLLPPPYRSFTTRKFRRRAAAWSQRLVWAEAWNALRGRILGYCPPLRASNTHVKALITLR